MSRIVLIHWNRSETTRYFAKLHEAGHKVDHEEEFRPEMMKRWRSSPPAAFVIDLSRLPSHGREIAVALRQNKFTRGVPIVFCQGERSKVETTRGILPDAFYCDLKELKSTLKEALSAPRQENPIRPMAMMDRYLSRTAAQKLGIKPCLTVALVNAPRDVDRVLGELPEGVELIETERGDSAATVHLCFVTQPDDLTRLVSELRQVASTSKLWILWPKGGKASKGELTENMVRQHGLDVGLVDYKVCSVNEVWSALLFALRK